MNTKQNLAAIPAHHAESDDRAVFVPIRLTPAQIDKLKLLGSKWIGGAIDRAFEPAQPADYLQMSSETSAAFILDRITPHVRPYSSNGTIARLVADCEAEANKLRLTLDKSAFASAYDLRDSLALGV